MLKQQIGKTVTLQGKAMDSHSCAAVVLDDDNVVYIPVLDYWPKDLAGKHVEVRGVLKRKQLAPEATRSADGAVSHGASGDDYVLENAKWKTR